MPNKSKGKKEKKHKWIKKDYDGSIDIFAAQGMPSDFHNGPKCKKCGFEFCEHCNPEGFETECGAESIPAEPRKTVMGETLYNSYKAMF